MHEDGARGRRREPDSSLADARKRQSWSDSAMQGFGLGLGLRSEAGRAPVYGLGFRVGRRAEHRSWSERAASVAAVPSCMKRSTQGASPPPPPSTAPASYGSAVKRSTKRARTCKALLQDALQGS